MNWEHGFAELVSFRGEDGRIEIPATHLRFREIADWILEQKTRQSALEPDQVRRLLEIGFTFSIQDDKWFKRFFELEAWVKKHGKPPSGRSPLARWLEVQRIRRRKGKLHKTRVRWLEDFGIVWRIDPIEARIKELEAFRAIHGHCNVPYKYPENPGLGHCVTNTLRGKKESLAPEHIRKLDEMGFVWDVREAVWSEHFGEFKAFVRQHGEYPTHQSNSRLASWVRLQRKVKQPAHRVRRLNSVNFVWDPREEHWMSRYLELKAFKRNFGHVRVPSDKNEWRPLWAWLHFQKRTRLKMSPEKRDLLTNLGVEWTIRRKPGRRQKPKPE